MWRWEAGPPVVEADMMWWATAMGPEVIGSGGGLGLQQLGARTRVSLWIQHHPRVGSLHHIRRPLRRRRFGLDDVAAEIQSRPRCIRGGAWLLLAWGTYATASHSGTSKKRRAARKTWCPRSEHTTQPGGPRICRVRCTVYG